MEVTDKESITNEEHVNTNDLRELAEHRKTRTGMEQKTQKVDRIASPRDEMRTTLQAIHSRSRSGGKFCRQAMNHTMSAKDEEKEEHQPQRCGAGTNGKTCTYGTEMPSMKNDWKPRLLNDKLQVDSTSQNEVLRTSDIKEPAANSMLTDKPRESANYDRSPQSIDPQKKGSSNHDQEKEKREPRLRAIAMEAELKSHTITNAASQGDERLMTKADLDWSERTKEAGAEPKDMVRMKIVFHLHNQGSAGTAVEQIKITSHALSHQARFLIALKIKTILQKFTEADGERSVPLQGKLTKEKEPPDKGNSETFLEEQRKCRQRKHKIGDCSGYCNGGRWCKFTQIQPPNHANQVRAAKNNIASQAGKVTAIV